MCMGWPERPMANPAYRPGIVAPHSVRTDERQGFARTGGLGAAARGYFFGAVDSSPTPSRRMRLRKVRRGAAQSGERQREVEPIPESIEAMAERDPVLEDDGLLERLRSVSVRVQDVVPDCIGMSVAMLEDDLVLTLVATDAEIAVLDSMQYL